MSHLIYDHSFVIPVLDLSPHSRYSIETLLEDLNSIPGEVICIFNSRQVYERLKHHPRIDKWCFNKTNAGVSRSWNLGIHLAEGRSIFVLNADLHLSASAVTRMAHYLHHLPKAVLVGPHGSYLDFQQLRIIRYFEKGKFDQPIRTHDVSGFFFAIHQERYFGAGLNFDGRYSPCFMEEWDMGMQIMKADLACYAVPVTDFDHEWGISGDNRNSPVHYFGRTVYRNAVLTANRQKFIEKWFPQAA